MSELSTVAIKDGHRGHLHHNHAGPDAERADRISRLAGFDRVSQPSRTLTPSNAGSTTTGGGQQPQSHQPHGYFDANNVPHITRERSTVGSASATGSVGGRTTWASGSDVFGEDKMSEDMDVDGESSVGGFSDEAASLVGFGEGARTPARQLSGVGSPTPPGPKTAGSSSAVAGAVGSAVPPSLRQGNLPPSPMSGVSTQTTASAEAQRRDARMIDGMTYDEDVVDTADRTPPLVEEGGDAVMSERDARASARNLRSNGPV